MRCRGSEHGSRPCEWSTVTRPQPLRPHHRLKFLPAVRLQQKPVHPQVKWIVRADLGDSACVDFEGHLRQPVNSSWKYWMSKHTDHWNRRRTAVGPNLGSAGAVCSISMPECGRGDYQTHRDENLANRVREPEIAITLHIVNFWRGQSHHHGIKSVNAEARILS